MSDTLFQPPHLEPYKWSEDEQGLRPGSTLAKKIAGAHDSCKNIIAPLRYRKILRSQRRRRTCFMVKNFGLCRQLSRFFGCFFISDLTENRLDKAKATFMTPYAFYSLAWFSVLLYFQGQDLFQRAVKMKFPGNFSHVVSMTLNVALMAKVLLNFVSMTFGTCHLLEFFRMCARYEISSGFRPPRTQDSRKTKRILIIFRLIIITGAAAMSTIMVSGYIQHVSRTVTSWGTIATAAARLICLASYFFYDSLMYLVVRSTCEVLVWYVRAQKNVFDECRPVVAGETALSTLQCEQSTSFKVDSVRHNMSKIRDIKFFINNVWAPALSLSSVLLVWMCCMTFYGAVKNGVMRPDVSLSIIYVGYVSISYVELACISQSLSDEAQKLKESLRAIMTVKATHLYFREVQYLHDTIDPLGMCLCGAGFFRLDKPLIVAMTGALITYTVIIVQTSEEIMQHTVANATSVTS